MSIDLKTARRVVQLCESALNLRGILASLEGPGRKIVAGKISVTTAEVEGWSRHNEKSLVLENETALRIAFDAIKRHYEQRLAATIRELRQLDAEVPE